MALNFPITFSLAPLPTGLALDGDDFANAIVANLQATISGDFLTGQIGGNAPTMDVGPWANNGQWYFWDSSVGAYVQQTFASFSLPSGLIFPYGGTTAPGGFLLCDGSAVSRSLFPNLFAVCGTNFGLGTGGTSSTFGVPNLQGRAPIGYGASGLGNVYSMGQAFGVEQLVLTSAQIPSHTHTISVSDGGHNHTQNAHTHTDAGHQHNIFVLQNTTTPGGSFACVGFTPTNLSGTGFAQISTNTATNVASVTGITATAANTGGDGAHTNVQPILAVQYIIKT